MSRAVAPPAEDRTEVYLKKREAVLAAAAQVFNQKGLKGATLADVAEMIGLSGNSITYYSRFKEELAVDCYLRTIGRFEEMVAVAADGKTVEARIRSFFSSWFAQLGAMAEGRHDELINFYDIAALSRANFELVGGRFAHLARAARRMVQESDGPAERESRHARSHLVLSIAFGVRNWIGRYAVEDYARAAERTADIVANGIFSGDVRAFPETHRQAASEPERRGHSRESFLRAATALINDQGYRGASVDKIAAKLGVTKGSFYHHIDAKDDLVAGCFERSFTIMRDMLRDAAARHEAPADRLLWAATALTRHQLSPEGPLLRYTALSAMPEAMRPAVKQAGERLTQSLGGLIADAVADRTARPIDAAIAAQVLDTTINAAAGVANWTPCLDAEQRLRAYLRPLLFGLARRPTTLL